MRDARRTLGCWLLAAFLERGGDPTRAHVPLPVPLVRPVSDAELRRIAGPLAPVVELARSRSSAANEAAPTCAAGRLLPFPLTREPVERSRIVAT